ncbi:TetR family transcriptional regulator [Amylibacter marinus]|uniref:TetR family transcriptional regulator n=1 Tax=Amylibacter marinus TaxID=1475483 RepID=A0ABQ5VUP4_9RHOB|nr:TetR/AcrR family transcriptional regulator [Amylibacter marinus]GLQ35157.1 TetR family transcriptional regulator [Amylibacter marinus]
MVTDTKTNLLNSAEHAARTRGFDGFSYADLAAEVKITKASIHHHFANKATLAVALMQRYHTDLKAACAEIDLEHATGAACLSALISRYHGALEGGQSLCLCVSFSTSIESLSAQTIAEMNSFRSMMIEWISQKFRQGKEDGSIQHVLDPEAEAAALLPLLEGAQLAARVAQDTQRFEAALRLVSQRFQT